LIRQGLKLWAKTLLVADQVKSSGHNGFESMAAEACKTFVAASFEELQHRPEGGRLLHRTIKLWTAPERRALDFKAALRLLKQQMEELFWRPDRAQVSSLQAHKLIQIYTNTDYCLPTFCTWVLTTSASATRCAS
jgi:hypothetical protein